MYRASHPRIDPDFSFAVSVVRKRKRDAYSGAPHREVTADILCDTRCPVCRAALVARMGRRGPYFHCLCTERGG